MPKKRKGKRRADEKARHERKPTDTVKNLDFSVPPSPLLASFPVGRTTDKVDAAGAANYLEKYIQVYRQQHKRFVASPPDGQGYPDLRISPFLYSTELTCALAFDGYVLWDGWDAPTKDGALKLSPPAGRIEPEMLALTGSSPARLVIPNSSAPECVITGIPTGLLSHKTLRSVDNIIINISQYAVSFIDLLTTICFGAGTIVEIVRKTFAVQADNFWVPTLIRDCAFVSVGAGKTRYIHYLEASLHTELAAWDARSIWVRVNADIARDFRRAIEIVPGYRSGFGVSGPLPAIIDRLNKLGEAIVAFKDLLETDRDSDEKIFHDFLYANPVLIDVYGWVVSKPRWRFPDGVTSSVGKSYLEPDFVVRYHGNRYKLVEIEKPSKRLATEKGHPRSEVGQAANQIAEWRQYLKYNADMIRDDFPNIGMDFTSMLVISRSSAESVGPGRDIEAVEELYGMQYSINEFYTYDSLLSRAQIMYDRLSAISIGHVQS
jgi:hypothetical protein